MHGDPLERRLLAVIQVRDDSLLSYNGMSNKKKNLLAVRDKRHKYYCGQ